MTPQAQRNLLTAIAHTHLGIATLEPRNSDRLDFHEVGVGPLLEALQAAFAAGRLETQQEEARSAQAAQTTLFDTAREGDIALTHTLLRSGADPLEKSQEGSTALMVAAYKGHLDVARALIDAGAQVDAQDQDGATALHRAAYQGHTEVVHLLIERGAFVNLQAQDGENALMNAARRGRTEIVLALLQAEADFTQRDWMGITAEELADQMGHIETAAVLAEHRQAQEQEQER